MFTHARGVGWVSVDLNLGDYILAEHLSLNSNYALLKPAWQQSTGYYNNLPAYASRANDGLAGEISPNSCSLTQGKDVITVTSW